MSTAVTVTSEQTHVVRDRRFYLSDDDSILAALAHLRREAATGQFIVDISQGGLCSLRFREERKVTFNENKS